MFIAARGLGKTYLSAIYCVIRCILYPGTEVCIASGKRGQAILVIEKITNELKPKSEELRAEINEKESQVNNTNARIVFNNTSIIKVVTAADSARGNRCNVLLLDEFRLISKDTIDTILKKFLIFRRMPDYAELTDKERNAEYDKEKNLTMYLSSAYFKDHWSYTKCVDTLKGMVGGTRRQFVCGFPYQLSISEGLIDPGSIEEDMAESDFSEVKFSMEMCAEFYGSADGAFFDYESIANNRRIKYPMLPSKIISRLDNTHLMKIPPKQSGEIRILSADIALMSSKKHDNDASAIFVNQLSMTKAGRYTSNIVFADSCEGLRTDEQALVIRKYFDEFMCDYIVLDANGIGLGVYDALARDIVDHETGEVYPALSCCNNTEMADRCAVQAAPKVIWAIKASAQLNSDMAFALREGFRSGRVRLLVNEYDADELLSNVRGYASLSPIEKINVKLPYVHTTLLIDELVNLQHEESGGRVKISEKSGRRKDRYSSLSYNYYVAMQLESKLVKQMNNTITPEMFIIKPPSTGRAVNRIGEQNSTHSWRG